MVMNINAVRIWDEEFGRVSFEEWEGLNDYEKLAAKVFEDGLEVTLENHTPTMFLEPTADCSDLTVHFWIGGLGNSKADIKGDGPCWAFSLKETFEDIASDYSEEDQADILKSLAAVTEYVRAIIERKSSSNFPNRTPQV